MIRAALAAALLAAPPALARPLVSASGIPEADIVILGEVHDNPAHHLFQAEAVAAIGPAAVIWEMLPPGIEVDPSLPARELSEALEWEARGWPDFALYAPVFAAAPDAVHLGMALPREDVRAAIGEGAAAVFGKDAVRFGLDLPLPDAEQEERETAQLRDHCDALPAEMLGGFVEAQRLRDAGFARAALTALEAHGGPVVVITGNGHARTDWGMPVYLAAAAPEVSVVSVGQLERDGADDDLRDGAPFGLWTFAEPPERGDPCEAFR